VVSAGMNILGLAPLILIFPAVGFLLNGLFGRRFVNYDRSIGEKWSGWLGSVMALSAFAMVALMAVGLVANDFHAESVPLFK